MKTIKLYTGGGVSLSPMDGEGRRESEFVRLIADDGKGITDGNIVTVCVDTKTPEAWSDCDAPNDEPIDEQKQAEALTRYANSITGASDQTLVEAAETLIIDKIKEES